MGATALGFWASSGVNTELWAWGRNDYGQLGLGDTVNRSSPVQVDVTSNSPRWDYIDITYTHQVARKTNGTIWAWGTNVYGQQGLGDTVSRSSPVQIGALTTWADINAGNRHTVAVKTDGTLWAWGGNNYGQLGDGTAVAKSSPIQIGALADWLSISAAGYHTLATKTDGTMWTWGLNFDGQLGLGDTARRSSPVQIGSSTDWNIVNASYIHSSAINNAGELWAWGTNTPLGAGIGAGLDGEGRLGDGTIISKSSPVQIGALTDWASISSTYVHSAAIKTDGTLWAWGGSYDGLIGDGFSTGNNRSSPVQIGALTTWAYVTAGGYHTLARKTNGTLWSWGPNNYGQLGQGDIVNRSSPVQIGAENDWTTPISGGASGSFALRDV